MTPKVRKNRFAEMFKKARVSTGLNQASLAKILGVTQVTISLYESGKREPNLDDLMTIAEKLGTTPNELLGFAGAPRPSVRAGGNAVVAVGSNIVQIAGAPRRRKPESS